VGVGELLFEPPQPSVSSSGVPAAIPKPRRKNERREKSQGADTGALLRGANNRQANS
jgi:hypothetical protein